MTLLRRVHFPLLAPLVAAGLVVVLALALVPPAEAAAKPPKKCLNKHHARQHPKACTPKPKPRPKPKPVWSPGPATTFNYPFATAAKRNAIRHRVLKAVKYTPRGARIRLATFSYADAKMTRALIKAHKRGVSVQLLVNRDKERLGPTYHRLQRALGDRRKPRHGMSPAEVSFARSCLRSCRGSRGNLHSKIFLFSQVGHTRWVSMVGSANLTRKAARGQWNHMDTLVGEPTYVRLGMLFNQMKADRRPEHPIWKFRAESAVYWAFPHAIADPRRDPMVRVLRRISCRATPHTGIPVRKARAKTARKKPGHASKAHPKPKTKKQTPAPRPITRRTVIRIGMYAWFDDRGNYLAREVRRKWNAGCSVKVVYSVLNKKVKRILFNPSGRGRIPMRRVVRTNELTGEVVDYNHSKYLAMSGTYRHRGHRLVWSGSMNFTGFGLYCDDLVFRLHGKRVVRAYFHNFHRVWRSPKASRPIPTRAFGTLSRLAPVPGAAGLSGVAGVAPETDELESPELGVGELSGFDQD